MSRIESRLSGSCRLLARIERIRGLREQIAADAGGEPESEEGRKGSACHVPLAKTECAKRTGSIDRFRQAKGRRLKGFCG